MKSVGIDIGTSTTKFMISELTLGRVSSHFALPHFDIVDRKVTYVSDIISTPLKNEDEIDLVPLITWIEKEYKDLGLKLSDIKSGAVIITGETAIKKNADALIHYLAERAGDFVVAIAGASLEGVLAGRGSGAYEHSLKSKGVIANIDIGGGTANVALFQQGKVLETITFHVGGRLIELDVSGKIISISRSLKPWLFDKNFRIEKGKCLTYEELAEIASALCFDLLDALSGKKSVSLLVHSSSTAGFPTIDELMISGGVGRLIEQKSPTTLAEVAKFNDFGPLLASELAKALKSYPFKVIKAMQTSSATVIGAGMQSTKLSGATISVQFHLLPLRNVPVFKVSWNEVNIEQQMEMAFKKGKELFGVHEGLPFAIGLADYPYLSYQAVKQLAQVMASMYAKYFSNLKVLVVVSESDIAKALGQLLRLQTDYDVICIDQVVIDHGDYIDIGAPLHDSIVPVVVKTLAFK